MWCGRDPWPGTESVEHLCPKSKGGIATPENTVLACARCNRLRGSTPVAARARQLIDEGGSPRVDLLRAALEGLAQSSRRAHREYGEAQLRHLRSLD